MTRTSSQDTGVARDADVIVATASLEVGYNDPEVGAVLQHKAPRDMASFLQRKGRAGRRRTMRPWTVVVLSDYGRDRLAYQGYDLLFDPVETVQYLSTICTLEPGDLVSTGTPAGVGHGRTPPVYLRAGQMMTTAIEGIGELVNRCVTEPAG